MMAIQIRLKFDSTCLVCGHKMPAGELALWQKGTGVAHPKHFSEEEKKRDGVLTPFREEKRP